MSAADLTPAAHAPDRAPTPEAPAGPVSSWNKAQLLGFLRTRYGTHSELTGRRLTSATPRPDLLALAEAQIERHGRG